MIELLISNGADINAITGTCDPYCDFNGMTAIDIAKTSCACQEIIDLLKSKGGVSAYDDDLSDDDNC